MSIESMNIDVLMLSISEEEPCGANLEYDPSYLELELLSKGKPETQMGNTIVPAEPPEWEIISPMCEALLMRSKDLRIATLYTRSLLNREGLPGLTAGLTFICRLLEERWATVHPQLDPDDNNDPLSRINALESLCEAGFLRELKEAPLFISQIIGRVTIRDIEYATGDVVLKNSEKRHSLTDLDGAIFDLSPEILKACLTEILSSMSLLSAIEKSVAEAVGNVQAINLTATHKLLAKAVNFLHDKVGGSTETHPSDDTVGDLPSEGRQSLRPSQGIKAISSRKDVIEALNLINVYYAKYEPSSPLPFLLKRAVKLVDMNFMDILRDINPESLDKITLVFGSEDKPAD